jgi:release factor glutamine methyltransferase
MPHYVPRVSAERVERLRRWHEDVSSELHARPAADIEYLGLQLHVPQGVFAPTPTSDLLGKLVTDHAAPGLRVLDMGCGAGANAILAARTGAAVLGVDVNPAAVDASRANAARNGVADRTDFAVSDLFDAVEGDFDLVVIDPPFRWFSPRTMLERAFTDENYATLTAFLDDVPVRLRPDGAVLLFFGTSGDVEYLDERISASGLSSATVAERTIDVRGEMTTYFVRRLSLDRRLEVGRERWGRPRTRTALHEDGDALRRSHP